MTNFSEGDRVRIVCTARETPFSSERIITLDTLDGAMDGLVQESELRKFEEKWHVRGLVDRVEEESLLAWVWGEFSCTGGLVKMPLESVQPWFE